MTLYDTLGVRSDASLDEIRTAYRRAARRHHPDTGDGSTVAMAAVTGAWKVLGDPVARRRYDQSLRRPNGSTVNGSTGGFRAADDHDDGEVAGGRSGAGRPTAFVDSGPARFPWKFMAGMAVAGIALVIVGAITAGPVPARKPDNLLQPNSCVVIQPNSDVAEVNCDDPHDAIVQQLIPVGSVCPAGSAAHRDRQGMGTACIVADAAVPAG